MDAVNIRVRCVIAAGALLPVALIGQAVAGALTAQGNALSRGQVAREDSEEEPRYARVAGTGEGLHARQGPGLSYPVAFMLSEGTTVRVMEGPVPDANGQQWLRVTMYDRASIWGWSASDFLVETDEPPAVETPQPARATAAPTASTSGRSFVATLSAYAHGSRTASGTPVRWGVVAVDPRVIPLGSKLRIEGFTETFVAEDTGGFRGNHVDIYFPDRASAIRFGIQRRTVTVLDS